MKKNEWIVWAERYGIVSLLDASNMWAIDKWIPLFFHTNTHSLSQFTRQNKYKCHGLAQRFVTQYVQCMCVRQALFHPSKSNKNFNERDITIIELYTQTQPKLIFAALAHCISISMALMRDIFFLSIHTNLLTYNLKIF